MVERIGEFWSFLFAPSLKNAQTEGIQMIGSGCKLFKGKIRGLIKEFKPAHQKVVIVSRVSSVKQELNDDLQNQEDFLRYITDINKLCFVQAFKHVGDGRDLAWLHIPLKTAKSHKAIILAESMDRIIRPESYSKTNQKTDYTNKDLNKLNKFLGRYGVDVITYLDSDTSYEEVRDHQSNRRNAEVVKADRMDHKEEYLSRVLVLHQNGYRSRTIARIISFESGKKISHMTVQRWLK